MDLAKPQMTFNSSDGNKILQVPATTKAGPKRNSKSFVPVLVNIPSGSYKLSMNITFTKNQRRILDSSTSDSQNLPNNFVISYNPDINFFIGSDEEIANKISIYNNSAQSSSGLSEKEIILAIVFSIFGFVLLIILGVYCWRKENSKKNQKKTENSLPIQSEGVLMLPSQKVRI